MKLIESNHQNQEKILGITNDLDDIKFDVFFHASLPNSNLSIGTLINIEAQKTTHLKYKINNRALLYSGYELTYQHGRIIKDQKYDDLKKVVSIWICFDAPTKLEENSISYFHLTKEIEIGYNIIEPKDYDKLLIVIIYLGKDSSNHELLKFLEVLFTNQLSIDEKIYLLKNDFSLKETDLFKKEIENMCNLADRIEEQGAILATFDLLLKKMNSKHMSLLEAMIDLCIDEDDYHIYINKFQELQID